MEYLSGVVERITYTNPENGFSVIKLNSKGRKELVTVVGNLAAVNVGSVLRVKGVWKNDSRYGEQFVAEEYRETVPATIAGIEKYLGSGLIKGIGPVYAKKIVNHFGEDTLQVIEESVDNLKKVEGIGEKRVEMIKQAWEEQKEIKNIMIFLQSSGISTAYAVKIYKYYGNESIAVVKNNPYRLADEVWGIGFKIADKIARQMGFDRDSFARCRAGIQFVLRELSNEGHCFATRQQLLEETVKILEVDETLVVSTLNWMVEEGSVVEEEGEGEEETAYYLPPLYHSERGTATRIRDIMSGQVPLLQEDLDNIIDKLQREQDIKYAPLQSEAIKLAASSRFMVLTGGPGTGKTTITRAIIGVFRKMGSKVYLAAPTGRAAKKMSEATGMEARTVHRLLEYKPASGYQKNADNPLDCDVLIVDEASMIDIVLMYHLLRAVPDHAVMVLVGDVDQLPSVGPGNVLQDIIQSGAVKVIQLSKIFRQAKGSSIITNAHRINEGRMPYLKGGKNNDFFFIEEEDSSTVVEKIRSLCAERLPRYYRVDPLRDIQVLSPMQRGETGARNLNLVLQEDLNSSREGINYGGTAYRVRDKVMQIKNNYEKAVFNGDIGVVSRIDREEQKLFIDFEGRQVEYDITELDELVLAYATTIHKSQGSEFKVVVAPLTTQHYVMLQKNLLYTCVTRARQILVLVGSKKAVGMAVSNDRVQQRNTRLSQRLARGAAIP